MKKLTNLAMLTLAVSLFAACAKEDFSPSDSLTQTVSSDVVIPELSTCKIRKIYHEGADGAGTIKTVWGHFTYNAQLNPYSVVYSNEGTGVFNHYFFYDAQKRLKEYQQSYVTFPVIRHFYKYNAANQIVTDSTVRINPGNAEINQIYISTIEYDSQGRVIKETIVNKYNAFGPLEPVRRPTYTYDNRGNLAVAGWKSSSYDNKVNPLQQNAIFQFIHRNYSRNNAAVQAKYNSRNVPLSMNPTNDQFFNGKVIDRVLYDCN